MLIRRKTREEKRNEEWSQW